jgi:hypothetical protein
MPPGLGFMFANSLPVRRHQQYVPRIAQVGHVTVGVTTIEDLERQFGKGEKLLGGHPHGARGWISKQTGWYVYSDGFDYNDKGRVVSIYSVGIPERPLTSRELSKASSIPKNLLMFMNTICPGTSRARALAAIHGLPATIKNQEVTLTSVSNGSILLKSNIKYTKWTAILGFTRSRVSSIKVECE